MRVQRRVLAVEAIMSMRPSGFWQRGGVKPAWKEGCHVNGMPSILETLSCSGCVCMDLSFVGISDSLKMP